MRHFSYVLVYIHTHVHTYVDLRHALRLLGTCFNGLGDIDEEGLVGAREELDHGREATALPDGHTVVSILGTLSQGPNNIHKDLQDIHTHAAYVRMYGNTMH